MPTKPSALLFFVPLIAFAAPVQVLRVLNGGIQPQVVVESDGTVDLLYFSGDPKNGDLFFVRSGSAPLRVNSQPGSAFAIGTIRGGQMAIGPNGRVHVAWNGSAIAIPVGPVNPESGKPGSPMLYSRLNDSGSFRAPKKHHPANLRP